MNTSVKAPLIVRSLVVVQVILGLFATFVFFLSFALSLMAGYFDNLLVSLIGFTLFFASFLLYTTTRTISGNKSVIKVLCLVSLLSFALFVWFMVSAPNNPMMFIGFSMASLTLVMVFLSAECIRNPYFK